MQYIEDNLSPTTGNTPSEVLTCVRELYYDDLHWTFLVDRDSVPRLVVHSSLDRSGAFSVRDGMDLAAIMALGRTYELADPSHFVVTPKISLFGYGIVFDRKVRDRHEYVILPDGRSLHIGHALAGLEVFLFPPSSMGGLAFDYPKSAATWAGDLGQAVFDAFIALMTSATREEYDTYWELHPELVTSAWATASSTKARDVEMLGDVHGIGLGRAYVTGEPGRGAHLPAGRPLSELLEEYFVKSGRDARAVELFVAEYEGYGMTARTVDNGQMSTIEGLRSEVNSFALTWDILPNPLQEDWDGTQPTDRLLITHALEYLNDLLEGMDP